MSRVSNWAVIWQATNDRAGVVHYQKMYVEDIIYRLFEELKEQKVSDDDIVAVQIALEQE